MKTESSHHDHHYTITHSGAWYAPTGRNEAPDYLGAEFTGYRVTKKLQSPNHTALWEVSCLKCGAKKNASSTLIKRGLEGARGPDTKVLVACKCPDVRAKVPLRTEGVRDLYDLSVDELRTVIAVIACEKMGGYSPTRIEVVAGTNVHAATPALVRKGWIKTVGKPMRMSSTPKARRELGVTP